MFLRLAVVRRRPQIGFRYLPTSFQLHPSWNPEIYELHGCRRFEFLECWVRTAPTRQPRYDDDKYFLRLTMVHHGPLMVYSIFQLPSNFTQVGFQHLPTSFQLHPSWNPKIHKLLGKSPFQFLECSLCTC